VSRLLKQLNPVV